MTAFLVRAAAILAIATSVLSQQVNSSSIAGTWYNELGSTAVFVTENGTLSGKYNSAVGNAEDFYVLTGRYETSPTTGKGQTLGWTVNYRNNLRDAHSTTTWSGQYFGGDEETILTHWLLTRATTLDDSWESTYIGTDVFTRTEPTEETKKIAARSSKGSPRL